MAALIVEEDKELGQDTDLALHGMSRLWTGYQLDVMVHKQVCVRVRACVCLSVCVVVCAENQRKHQI